MRRVRIQRVLDTTVPEGEGLLLVELNGGEDSLKAFADALEFLRGHVADAADVSAAEVVDDQVEAVAGAVAGGGVDLVARLGADSAVFVVAVGEGGSGDCGGRGRVGVQRGGLADAVGVADVRGEAGVEVRSAKGGEREWIEGDVGHRAHLGGVRDGAGVEREGADLVVLAGEGPAGGDLEGDAGVRVAEAAGGRSLWIGWRERRGQKLLLGVDRRDSGDCECEGEDESHAGTSL